MEPISRKDGFFSLIEWNGFSEAKKIMALTVLIELIKLMKQREFMHWTALIVLLDLL